jgi:hypothetical protein
MGWGRIDVFVVCVVTLMGVVYVGLLLGLTDKVRLPEIFDLPKHLFAMYSAGGGGWPGVNPYYPDAPFAYNLLFYQPWAIVAKLSGGGVANITCFAFATLWMGAVLLGVLRRVAIIWGMGEGGQAATVFFASVAGGLGAWVAAGDAPEGYILAAQGKAAFWVDDPFTSLVYVPQHVFAVSAIAAAVLLLFDGKSRSRWVGVALCMSAAALASFILAPLVLGATLWLAFVYGFLSRRIDWRRATLFAALTLVVTVPWLWVVKHWAGPDEALKVGLFLAGNGSGWVVLSAGVVVPLMIAGLTTGIAARNHIAVAWAGLIIGGVCFIAMIHFPDSAIKGALYLRLLAAPAAAAGLIGLVGLVNRLRPNALPLVIVLVIAPSLAAGVFGIGLLLSSAVRYRPAPEAALIRELRRLPVAQRWLIYSPSQDLPSVLGRACYYDFRAREDRYIPHAQRGGVAETYDSFRSEVPSSAGITGFHAFDRVIVSRDVKTPSWWGRHAIEARAYGNYILYEDIPPLGDEAAALRNLLMPEHWQWFGPKINICAAAPACFRLEASTPTDSGFVLSSPLSPGAYRIQLQVEGDVYGPDSGGAHLSLFGKRKLLSLPPGKYEAGLKHVICIRVAPGESSPLAFGFGGWSTGFGTLKVTALTVEPLKRPVPHE